MSILSSALHGIDSAIHKIPIVGKMIPSAAGLVGGVVGGGIGQLSGSALNHTLGSDLAKGATNAAVIAPAITAATRAASASGGAGGGYDVNGEPLTQGAGSDGGSGGWLDTIENGLGSVGKYALGHVGDIAKLGLGAGAAIEGVKNDQQANKWRQQAIDTAMEQPTAPDLSSLFANPSNPFSRGRVIPAVGRKTP